MKTITLDNGIILFHAETQYELTSTFVRIQEFYESPFPEIRGNYFDLMTFMDRYVENNAKTEKGPEFTYFTDWAGFNVPGHVVKEFFRIFNDLNHKEQFLKDNLESYLSNNEKFYIIGTYGNPSSKLLGTVLHECAHAYYYIDAQYKNSTDEIVATLPQNFKQSVYSYLASIGYTESVFDDELQAYVSTQGKNVKDLCEAAPPNTISKLIRNFASHAERVTEVYNKHFSLPKEPVPVLSKEKKHETIQKVLDVDVVTKVNVRNREGKFYANVRWDGKTSDHRRPVEIKIKEVWPEARLTSCGINDGTWRLNPEEK